MNAVEQRLQVSADHAFGIQLAQELVRHQQRVQLPLAEPQPRQFMLLPAVFLAEPVAVQEAVVLDRGTELVLEVVQVALEGGRRHLQLVQQRLKAHVSAVADEHLDLVDARGLGHLAAGRDAQWLSDFDFSRRNSRF